jgi:hypothetical protein
VNPFAALGLPPRPDLTDDEVRAAWRAIAARTHPDRRDGGDPAAYVAASAAYEQLRTPWGRSEALADLDWLPAIPPPAAAPPAPAWAGAWHAAVLLPARIRHGRPLCLAARAAVAAIAGYAAVLLAGGTPSAPAAVTGCALWWLATARADLAPPPGR